MRGLWCGLALIAALPAAPARAEGGTVGELKDLSIERHRLELESRLVHVHRDGEDLLAIAAAAAYSLSGRTQWGAEIKTAGAGGSRQVEEAALFVKWRAVEFAGGALGVQPGLVIDPRTGKIGSETFLIAQGQVGGIDLVGNLLIVTDPGEWRKLQASYAARGSWAVVDDLALGIEAGGALTGDGRGSHFAGAVVGYERPGIPAIELSLFGPLTAEAPDLQIRLEVETEL